jgi:FkbM family methyltransferase
MGGHTGPIWKWRQRLAYRLLARPARAPWDSDDGESAPVRLDFPAHDIWLRATSATERRWRARACAKEPWTVRWIQEQIGRGEVLYDIGANVGAFSLVAAIDRGASVVAFEPGYANFARLCENIQLNACGTAIMPVPLPLNDEGGTLSFTYRSLEPGQSRHALGATDAADVLSAPYVQPMCATTLDRAVVDFKLPVPHHLKIDVDGRELHVLRGAAAVLRGPQLRTILVESESGAWDALAAEFGSAGFTLQSRHERPGKRGAPLYAVWTRP